jgi:hypothetical protein
MDDARKRATSVSLTLALKRIIRLPGASIAKFGSLMLTHLIVG